MEQLKRKPIEKPPKLVSFIEQKPRSILFILGVITTLLFLFYIETGLDERLSFVFSGLWLAFGYLFWVLLFTDEGAFFYNEFLLNIIETASFPRRLRFVMVWIISVTGILLSVFLINSSSQQFDLIGFSVILSGLGAGFLTTVGVPDFSISKRRKDIYVITNLLKLILPLLFIPILLTPWKNFWGFFTLPFSLVFFGFQASQYIRHLAINYILSVFLLSDEFEKEGHHESIKELCSPSKLLNIIAHFKFEKPYEDFDIQSHFDVNKLAYPYSNVYARVLYEIIKECFDSVKLKFVPLFPLSITDEKLRGKFRVWYAKRNYSKIIKYGSRYVDEFLEIGNFNNMSYVITSLYYKALIRSKKDGELRHKLYSNYGDGYVESILNVDRAYIEWNKGNVEEAIKIVRPTTIKQPTYNAAKNCMVFYLCNSASKDAYSAIKNQDVKKVEEVRELTKEKLEEARELLLEIQNSSELLDIDSYYWSNNAFYNLIKWNLAQSEENYRYSLHCIKSKENVRSRIGLGLIDIAKESFYDARFHFDRAVLEVSKNKNSRYYQISSAYIHLIETLMRNNREPHPYLIFGTDEIVMHSLDFIQNQFNIEEILEFIPEFLIPPKGSSRTSYV